MKILGAMDPEFILDAPGLVFLRVWFEELDGWVPFIASPFDIEVHGKELWIRALAGEYGKVQDATKALGVEDAGNVNRTDEIRIETSVMREMQQAGDVQS